MIIENPTIDVACDDCDFRISEATLSTAEVLHQLLSHSKKENHEEFYYIHGFNINLKAPNVEVNQ